MSVPVDTDIAVDAPGPGPGHTPQTHPPAAVTATITGAKDTMTDPPPPKNKTNPSRKLNPTTPSNNPSTQR